MRLNTLSLTTYQLTNSQMFFFLTSHIIIFKNSKYLFYKNVIACDKVYDDFKNWPPGSLSVDNLEPRTKSTNFVTSFGSIQPANAR